MQGIKSFAPASAEAGLSCCRSWLASERSPEGDARLEALFAGKPAPTRLRSGGAGQFAHALPYRIQAIAARRRELARQAQLIEPVRQVHFP